MRRLVVLTFLVVAIFTGHLEAASKIIKVLPQYIDLKGRHALSPSLYERDAYQAFLREHPGERSALRFNVQWKSDLSKGTPLTLRLETRGAHEKTVQVKTIEATAQKDGWFSNWTAVEMKGDDYKAFGELLAWRATLWNGDKQVAEQKSFLW